MSTAVRELPLGARPRNHGSAVAPSVLAVLVETALIAVERPEAAGVLARAVHEAGVVPVLAFSSDQIIACVERERFGALVVHADVLGDAPESVLAEIGERSEAPLVLLERHGSEPAPALVGSARRVLPDTVPPERVAAAVAALGRRRRRSDEFRLHWGPLELDLSRRQAWWREERLALTPTQLRLLSVLVCAGGAVVTNDELSQALWGTALPSDPERLFAHIRRIRKRLERDPARPAFLLTVRGEGFRLADTVAA